MKGVVMAGGRASRFGRKVDKGVLRVGDLSLLERATSALSTPCIDSVTVAVTRMSNETETLARKKGLEVLRTSGKGYHADTLELLDSLGRYVSLNVDVPFVSVAHVEGLLSSCPTGSAAAVVPMESSSVQPEPGSLMVGPDGRTMIWVGLNVVSDEEETDLVIFEDGLLAVNVNDDHDLRLANELAKERGL